MATILIVDDSATDRQLAGGLLSRETDWELIYAADGREAIDVLEQNLPDLVLTDLRMPEINGLELVSRVKTEYPLLPVVLMTAQGSEEIAVEALQQGAASYVPKRTLATDLRETVERILSNTDRKLSHSRLMKRMTNWHSNYVLENDLALISSLVNHLQLGLDHRECLLVATALDEALLNAYYHGNLEVDSALREEDHGGYYELARQRTQQDPYCQRRLHVEARLTPEEAVYVIRDEGPGFDPAALPDPTDPANIERCYGRGLLLMTTFMDEVLFNDKGNEVTMVKRREPSTAEDELDPEDGMPAAADAE